MTQYEKNKIESFKENILQNLLNTIKQRITIFKSKCEELVETSSNRFKKQVDHLQMN